MYEFSLVNLLMKEIKRQKKMETKKKVTNNDSTFVSAKHFEIPGKMYI